MSDFAAILFNIARIMPWLVVALGLWQVILIREGRAKTAWTGYCLALGSTFLCFVAPAVVYGFDNADGSIQGDVATNLIGSMLWAGIGILTSGGVGLALYAVSWFAARSRNIAEDSSGLDAIEIQPRYEKEL